MICDSSDHVFSKMRANSVFQHVVEKGWSNIMSHVGPVSDAALLLEKYEGGVFEHSGGGNGGS